MFDPPFGHHQDTQPTQPTHHEVVAHPPSSSDAQVFFFLTVFLGHQVAWYTFNMATFGSQFSCSLGMGGYANGSFSK